MEESLTKFGKVFHTNTHMHEHSVTVPLHQQAETEVVVKRTQHRGLRMTSISGVQID